MAVFVVTALLMLTALKFSQVYSELQTFGSNVTAAPYYSREGRSTWLDANVSLPEAAVAVRWRLYCRQPYRSVRLQIWRPVDTPNTYRLVSEQRFQPTNVGLYEYDIPFGHQTRTSRGDRIGLTNDEEAGGPVAMELTAGGEAGGVLRMVAMTAVGNTQFPPEIGQSYTFENRLYGRRFSLNIDTVRCEDEWEVINHDCGRLAEKAGSWVEASSQCARLGASLISLHTEEFTISMRNFMISKGISHLWLNLKVQNDVLYWLNNPKRNVSYFPWERNVTLQSDTCVALTPAGRWSALNCSHSVHYVCMKDDGIIPPHVTTDMPSTNAPTTITAQTSEYSTIISSNVSVTTTTEFSPQLHEDNKNITNYLRKLLGVTKLMASRELSLNARILEAIVTGYRRNVTVTDADLLLTSRLLDSLKGQLTLKKTHARGLFETYVKNFAGVLNAMFSNDCQCVHVWRDLQLDNRLSPMSVLQQAEDMMASVIRLLLQQVVTVATPGLLHVTAGTIGTHVQLIQRVAKRDAFIMTTHSGAVQLRIPLTVIPSRSPFVGISVISTSSLIGLLRDNGSFSMTSPEATILSISSVPPLNLSATTPFYFQTRTPLILDRDDTATLTPACVFWNHSTSTWSTAGCDVIQWNTSHTTCRCSHMTSFAVLMQVALVKESVIHSVTLSMISYVGCTLSIFGLAATIIIYVTFRIYTVRAFILINLCVALLLGNITFITGITSTHNRVLCAVVAMALHYTFLSAFFWMLVQGFELYRKLRHVFSDVPRRMAYYAFTGWGLPCIIVAVSVGMRLEHYGVENFCWLSMRTGLVWSFLAPVVIIIAINFVILCSLVRIIRRHPETADNSELDSKVNMRTSLKSSFVLLPVLGLTWIIGLLAVNEHSIIFQYLFAFFNSLQGFLIFLFHCFLNNEVRTQYLQCRHKRQHTDTGTRIRSRGQADGDEDRRRASMSDSCHTEVTSAGGDNLDSADCSCKPSGLSSSSRSRLHTISSFIPLPGRSKRFPISDPKYSCSSQQVNMACGEFAT